MIQSQIQVANLDDLLKDLKALNPKLRSDLMKGLTKAVRPVRDEARKLVPDQNPISNWRQSEPTYTSASWANDFEHRGGDAGIRWKWSPSDVRRGIKVSRAKFRTGRASFGKEEVSVVSLINTTAPGIIYELTGSGKGSSVRRTKRVSRNPDSRIDFVNAMDYRRGKPKRLVYRAAATKGKKALDDIQKVLDERLYKFVRNR